MCKAWRDAARGPEMTTHFLSKFRQGEEYLLTPPPKPNFDTERPTTHPRGPHVEPSMFDAMNSMEDDPSTFPVTHGGAVQAESSPVALTRSLKRAWFQPLNL